MKGIGRGRREGGKGGGGRGAGGSGKGLAVSEKGGRRRKGEEGGK